LEFFCEAGFYKDTAPTVLKGKAAPVSRSGFGIIPANLFYCTTARKNRFNTWDSFIEWIFESPSGLAYL